MFLAHTLPTLAGHLQHALLYLRAARRPLAAAGVLRTVAVGLDERPVFVFGSPRSGTTFLGGTLGRLPGFVDLGEVLPLKASIPRLVHEPPELAGEQVRRTLEIVRRLALVNPKRAVEQTPESAFLLPAIAEAFPDARLVHLVRDGRDVVCSLVERGWLRAQRGGSDDVGTAYGAHPRFWVEPGLEREFAEATEVRRAAWAWRRYVSSARDSGVPVFELRYERLVTDPHGTAEDLARYLGVRPGPLAAGLGAGRGDSIGRHRRDLAPEQLDEVELEAGELLTDLGYTGTATPTAELSSRRTPA